jgi:hypothetical protein
MLSLLCVTPRARALTQMQVVARAIGDLRRSSLDRDAALSCPALDLWEDEEVVPSHPTIPQQFRLFRLHTSAHSPAAFC